MYLIIIQLHGKSTAPEGFLMLGTTEELSLVALQCHLHKSVRYRSECCAGQDGVHDPHYEVGRLIIPLPCTAYDDVFRNICRADLACQVGSGSRAPQLTISSARGAYSDH